MRQYLELTRYIKENGDRKNDRTNTGTLEYFGPQFEFDLSKGFPAMTTKKLFMKGIIYELFWFLKGDTNIQFLVKNGVNIWNEWAYKAYQIRQIKNPELKFLTQDEFVELIKTDDEFALKWGDLGPVYGAQWRNWLALPKERHWDVPQGDRIDQISMKVEEIKSKPESRQLVICSWNVADLGNMALLPCHCLFQFNVTSRGELDCKLYQRSADMFLGVPFNIASYALLTMMMAQVTGLKPGRFIHTFGSAHIYLNHLEQIEIQLSREPRPLPTMKINPEVKSIFDFKYSDFQLINYNPHPAIKAPIAV